MKKSLIIIIGGLVILGLTGCSFVKSKRDKASPAELEITEDAVYGAYLSAELKKFRLENHGETCLFAVRQLTIENEITMEKVKLNYFGKKADFRTWLTKIGDRLLKKSISLDRLVKKSMISDFLVRNKKSRIIDEDLPTEAKYFIFRTAEELKLQNRKNPRTGEISFWYNFNQKYPLAAKTGVYSFSCSGFNDKMDQALILVSSSQGLIGEGKVVVFVRKKGIWIIKNELTLWIS